MDNADKEREVALLTTESYLFGTSDVLPTVDQARMWMDNEVRCGCEGYSALGNCCLCDCKDYDRAVGRMEFVATLVSRGIIKPFIGYRIDDAQIPEALRFWPSSVFKRIDARIFRTVYCVPDTTAVDRDDLVRYLQQIFLSETRYN